MLSRVLECFFALRAAICAQTVGVESSGMPHSAYEVDVVVDSMAPPATPPKTPSEKPKPPSPNSVADIGGVRTRSSARSAEILLKCQKGLVESYVALGIRGVFSMDVDAAGGDVLGHPVQDPTGALTAALLVIRRNRPDDKCMMRPPHETIVEPSLRRALAAILTTCHKMTVAHTWLNRAQYVYAMIQLYLLPHEIPRTKDGWDCEFALFEEAEVVLILSQPLFSIVTTSNPLSDAEWSIGQLVISKQLSKHQAHVLRGGCFFLLASCMFNPREEVLERLQQRHGMRAVGEGVVSLLLTLYYLANSRPGHPIRYRAPYGRNVDEVARVLLDNAMSSHSAPLRIGPYRAEVAESEAPHMVQLMLTPANLALAKMTLHEATPIE